MSTHPEHESAHAAPEGEDDNQVPSRADLIRQKLKIVAHYALLGFAPVVAVIALVVAVVAVTGNRAGRTQFDEMTAKLEEVKVGLAASKNEMENLKIIVARQKAQLEEEQKRQDELIAKIVPNVTKLQVKMKISPTLDEQLHQPASAPVAVPAADAPAHAASAAPATSAPAAAGKQPPQKLQAIKEAIEKFNSKK
ncbi:MAG TPA: hypothetical protein VK149_10265 [Sideroxyarcus sp.]|nr:hypothetical protein [Sideroxyarcus sp.]